MQNEYSWMYSPKDVMKIRMNGQLFLLKLAEMLYSKLDCYIFNWNTDGLFIKFKKKDLNLFNEVMKEFETFSQLTMETDEFEAMFQFAVNDYIAVKKGYSETKDPDLIKQKGMFISKVTLGKGMQPMIIPKALNEYFVNGISIIQTIKNSKDIHDFITYQKVDKAFSVEYNGKLVSRINRYYVSKTAPYLFKCKVDAGVRSGYINILKDHGVQIVNNIESITTFPTDIDYDYYIAECKKIIDQFECQQLSLF